MIVPYGFHSRLKQRLSKCPEGDDAGGAGGTGGGGAPDPKNPDPKSETVSREFAERLLGEKKAEQAKREAAELELKKYRDKEAELEIAKQKAAGDFETLEKTLRDEIAARDAKLAEHETLLQGVRKMSAFRRVLGAEVPEKFRQLVDLDEIKLGTDGQPDEASVTKYVSNFRKQYGEILGGGKKLPPDDGANGNPERKLTVEEWQKLPYADRKKRMHEVAWKA